MRLPVSEQAQTEAVDDEAAASVSELLIEAREAAGLSQADVAAKLYLTHTFIRYIDEGDFHKIPKGTAFIKGYLRAYAREVGLDGDAIVQRYESALPGSDDVAPIRDVTEETVGPVTFTGPVLQTGLMALGGLVIVIALVWYFAGADSPEPDSGTRAAPEPRAAMTPGAPRQQQELPSQDALFGSEPDLVAATSDPAELVGEAEAEAEASGLTDALVAADDSATAVGFGEPTGPEAAHEDIPAPSTLVPEGSGDAMDEFEDPGVSIERERAGEERRITVTADGSDVLEFSFTDDCWVQIEDTVDKVIYADLNRGGDVMSVTGSGPFTVLLGKAPAVRMRYNGARFDLSRYTMSDETAKVRTQ